MRTIKFLGFAVALAAVAGPLQGQGNIQPGAFPGIDRLARVEAARVARQHQMQQMGGRQFGRVQGRVRPGQPRGRFVGAHGFGGRRQPLVGAGVRAGVRAGFRAGMRAERLANATPEQKAFVEQLRVQRQTVRAQVVAGQLTREQAREQMQKWVLEHRPKK